jgi:ATP-dependent DNA helicase DinG
VIKESIFDTLVPSDLGLPAKFSKFRKPQREALDWLQSSCLYQLNAACLPTGAGKTLIASAFAKILGVKATYLVATKALQSQVLNDFSNSGMVDLRGRHNYSCVHYGDCDSGSDANCSLAQTVKCPYALAVDKASQSQISITNYAYWLHSGGTKNKAFAETELLICDEAHALESQLAGYASVKFYASELGRHGPMEQSGLMDNPLAPVAGSDGGRLATFAFTQQTRLLNKKRVTALSDEEDDLLDRCKRVGRMNPNWVWQFDDRGHVTFEPVRIAQFSRGLFGSVPRVLLMSASLNEFTLKLLIPSDVQYDFETWGSVFSPSNAPVYHIPTRKLNWRSTDEDYKAIIEQADKIVDSRLDRKGIIHTVSYARSQRALQYSRHRDRFVWNTEGSGLSNTLERFRKDGPGAILITPSVAAGFDFPGTEAEYQIILKFPFPNETQRVIKERCTQIPSYRLWSAAQEIVQMCGRARRYEEDRCETFVLDNSVKQLCGPEGRSYCPPGFRIFTVTQVPPAPPKISA